MRVTNAPLAQLVEQLIYTEKVGGSSPSGRTNEKNRYGGSFYFVPSVGIEPTLTA